jgi:hypothetical protein
MSTQIKRLY